MLINEDVVLIDGMNLYHRVYNVFINLHNKSGFRTGGIYGFIKSLIKYRDEFYSNNIIVCWDSKTNRRKEIYTNYKKDRRIDWNEMKKENFFASLKLLKSLLYYSGVIQLERKGYEADDLIWMMVKCFKRNIIIVTNDKDMFQLINDIRKVRAHVSVIKGFMHELEVYKKFLVKPKHLVHYLSMVGDKSDNIPGIYGWGKVRALSVLDEADEINNNYLRSVLNNKQFKEYSKSYRLIKLGYNISVDFEYKIRTSLNYKRVGEILTELQINSFGMSELKKLSNKKIKTKLKVHYEHSKENFS